MLNTLDIAVLCDRCWTDADGNRRTADRSRHGIHPMLGDGTTVGTFPTWDAQNGRFTFDGGDYMVLRAADDVAGVLAGMGGVHDETYMFYFDPYIQAVGATTIIFFKGDIATDYVRLRKTNAELLEIRVTENGVGNEILTAAATVPPEYNGKHLLLSFVRSSAVQQIWTRDILIASDTDATVDGSHADSGYIGSQDAGPTNAFPATTGLRFFGYAQQAFTQIQLEAIQKYLRGLL